MRNLKECLWYSAVNITLEQSANYLCFFCPRSLQEQSWVDLMIGHLFSSVWAKVTMSNTRGSRWGSINRLYSEPEAAFPTHTHTHTSTLPPSPVTGLGQSVTIWQQAFHNIVYTHSQRHVYTHAHTWHSSWHPSLQASVNSLLQIMRHVAKQCSILHQPFGWIPLSVVQSFLQ